MRQQALEWWKSLSLISKKRLAYFYKPDWTLEMIGMSSSTIEFIYTQEVKI